MTAKKGHNSIPKGQLRSYAERIERLDEEKAALQRDISEVYSEVRANGFDVKAFKNAIKHRRLDRAEFHERRTIEDMYLRALGLLSEDDK